jgi:hypothetical protein
MLMRISKPVVALVAIAALLGAEPASAFPFSSTTKTDFSGSFDQVAPITQIRWRGSRGAGVAAGIVGGMILGGIIASQRPRYYYPSYGYPPPYAYDDPGIAYCMRRYKSYDPYSMTYLGYDGYRHPCP